MIRPLHPIDMPSYMDFARRACYSEAAAGCNGSPLSTHFLDVLGRSLALDAPAQTWIYTAGGEILGLMAVKRRRGTAIWEVERLVGRDSPGADSALESLLEHLSCLGGREGVHKIFLRLPLSSPLLPIARRAGFFAYSRETIYRLGNLPTADGLELAPLRMRRSFDHQKLFQHYIRSVPARVRQAEGLTLQEWRWFDGWKPRRRWRFAFPRSRQDFVWERDDEMIAWLQIDRGRRLLQGLLDEMQVSPEEADSVLAFALSRLPASGPVFFPVREYQSMFEGVLKHHRFEYAGEYALLVRLLTVRVGERCLVPVGV